MDLICRCRSLVPLLLEVVLGRNASSQSPRFRIKELRHTHSPADCSAYDLAVLSAWSATFPWSADGKQLLLVRGEISSDAVLLSNLP